jgi:hypothetical protein
MYGKKYSFLNRLEQWMFIPPMIRKSGSISEGIYWYKKRWPDLENKHDVTKPVFIFSAGWGTGSTLLQRLLVSSNEIAVWGEPFDITMSLPRLASVLSHFNEKWPPNKFFVSDYNLENLSGEWIANLYPPVNFLKNSHRALFREWFEKPAEKFGVKRWGFKEVRYTIDHARYLKWLFPEAKFLFIYRNPFRAFLTIRGAKWYSISPYLISNPLIFASHWKFLLEGFIDGHKEVDGMLVKFEDLVQGNLNLEKIRKHVNMHHIDKNLLKKKVGARAFDKKLRYYEYKILKFVGGKLLRDLDYDYKFR